MGGKLWLNAGGYSPNTHEAGSISYPNTVYVFTVQKCV